MIKLVNMEQRGKTYQDAVHAGELWKTGHAF
jgi:hypothetical protein